MRILTFHVEIWRTRIGKTMAMSIITDGSMCLELGAGLGLGRCTVRQTTITNSLLCNRFQRIGDSSSFKTSSRTDARSTIVCDSLFFLKGKPYFVAGTIYFSINEPSKQCREREARRHSVSLLSRRDFCSDSHADDTIVKRQLVVLCTLLRIAQCILHEMSLVSSRSYGVRHVSSSSAVDSVLQFL